MDDFKKILYGVLVLFAVGIVVWLGFLFVNSCGFDVKCTRAQVPLVTPIPTLVPAKMPAATPGGGAGAFSKCTVKAMSLLGAWVDAGYPESDSFPFADVNGNPCAGTYQADIAPLLNESNLWFPASLSCTSCHNTAFKEGLGGLDLTSYAGILAGSQRASADVPKGNDILGGGNWENSALFTNLSLTENIPPGHPTLDHPVGDLIVYAGAHVPPPTPTDAPTPVATP